MVPHRKEHPRAAARKQFVQNTQRRQRQILGAIHCGCRDSVIDRPQPNTNTTNASLRPVVE